MKKAVWITLLVAIVGVNGVCWVGYQITGIYVPQFLRLTMILGLTVMAAVFTGTFLLIDKLEQERPLAGHKTKMTLRPSTAPDAPDSKPAATDRDGATHHGKTTDTPNGP
ncbi:MAG: hypothetical protein RLZZ385_2402 [Pseudomonadota bacterium]|jgi:hypothetical protein